MLCEACLASSAINCMRWLFKPIVNIMPMSCRLLVVRTVLQVTVQAAKPFHQCCDSL